jgi:hypothetical protein
MPQFAGDLAPRAFPRFEHESRSHHVDFAWRHEASELESQVSCILIDRLQVRTSSGTLHTQHAAYLLGGENETRRGTMRPSITSSAPNSE